MALNDLALSLMAFPQRWDAATQKLSVNLLLLPVGDPLLPLGAGPQFAGTTILLNAQFVAGLDSLPTITSVPTLTTPFAAAPPPAASALFASLLPRLPAGTTVTGGKLAAMPAASARIKKALPPSYTNAFAFEQPRSDDLIVGDGYGCAVKAQDPGVAKPPPAKIIAWGQILSFVLRQPQLAQALGLVYPLALDIPATAIQDGGWLFFALDASSPGNPYVADFAANPDAIKSYAARIPPLTVSRMVFAASLFPMVAFPGSNLAEAQLEAEIYDDGFAQVLHCHQPPTIDAATGDDTQIAPGAEAGVQIGWDDEQVTVWMNRQIDLLRDRVGGTALAPESPLGVQGYRVDVREAGEAAWHSLCKVTGSLPFSAADPGGAGATPSGELWVAPAPVRATPASEGDPNLDPAWLPLYFAQWRGSSLVVHDDTITKITPGVTPMPSSALGADLSQVPILRYGKDYEFQTRFVDLTGGGPSVDDQREHPGPAPVGFCPFRRFLPPNPLEVAATPPAPPLPARPEAVRTLTKLAVRRPRIGYPEALFAGANPGEFQGANLDALILEATNAGRALGVPDPDVDRFQVVVEARIPAHDTGQPGTLPGQLDGDRYRIVYSVVQHFSAPGGGNDDAVTLSLQYADVDDIAKIIAPPDDSAALILPTARDVRIRLIPLAAERSNYYGAPAPPAGLATDFIVRREASDETSLLAFDPPLQLKAIYFQPGGNLPLLLAQTLGLSAQGLTLSGTPGTRTVFGASGALRHTLSPNASALTFANQAELLDHWIVAFVLDLERDWTWDGFAEPGLTFFRDSLPSAIGTVRFPRTVSSGAAGDLQHPPDHSRAQVVFLDALHPLPGLGGFPAELHPQYTVTAAFRRAAPLSLTYSDLTLPITTRPTQTPQIASTGIAETPFLASPDYSQTFLRDRFLWIEFDQPLADPEDQYFARVLAYGPDPLLAGALLPPQTQPNPAEPLLPIDPESARVIFAGQSSDESGLDAMTPLIPATPSGALADGLHFLLPLPPGIAPEALELFGFWTYEFRVGHSQKWSTAQGRYGRPLRVTGLQHPAPHLTCTAQRNTDEIFVTAPYATAVVNGTRVYDRERGDPQTTLWVMLYAQVQQADGAAFRNILLDHQPARLLPDRIDSGFQKSSRHTINREPRAFAALAQTSLEEKLSLLGLPLTSPLSVLAVEVLPGPLHRENLGIAGNAGDGQEDPLGSNLGLRRILRTSPLTPVPAIC